MSALISPEYHEQLLLMRTDAHRPLWGNGGQRHLANVLALIEAKRPASVLDYGCGHGMLLGEIAKHTAGIDLRGYDPGIPERAVLPPPSDLVLSTDVLEHIEPDRLEAVLLHIRELTKIAAYLHIHTGPATAILPDGRNAHLIQQPAKWWEARLSEVFRTVEPVLATSGARKGHHMFGDPKPTYVCLV